MPMDRSKYPKDWEAISRRVRDQAGNRCEWCAAPNGEDVWRWSYDGAAWVTDHVIKTWPVLVRYEWCGQYVNGPTRIVLTVAHIHDPDPMNVDPSNLACLCQRCHNRIDSPMRKKNAAETRRKRRIELGQTTMEVVK